LYVLIGACLVTPRRRRALRQISCGERAAAVEIKSQYQSPLMDKPKVQERAKEAEATEPRKLNMEEKRKLEKLLIADIDSATERYDAETKTERQTLIERLGRTPPAEARALYERYKLAGKQRQELEAKLDVLGYDVNYHGDLAVNTSGTTAKQLAEFDDRADELRHSLATLKRSYVIKLFADHADTQSLFGSLAKDLERLIG
jgi:hypothetical protein